MAMRAAEMAARSRTFLARAKSLMRSFGRAEHANIGISFGLLAIPLLVSAGVAVDLSRALIVKTRLTAALDAAGLAVGKDVNCSGQTCQDLGQKFFDANYPAGTLGVPGQLHVNVDGQVVELDVTARVPTAIMQIVGFNYLDVASTVTISREATGLELALVLDTTGSMASNNKLTTMQSAATDLVNTLFGNSVYPENLKIGIVPFAEAVRVDTSTFNMNWIDTNGSSSTASQNFSGGKYAYWLYTDPNGMVNTPWKGCVETRPNGLDETDAPPSIADGSTFFVPMFQPDEPHVGEPEDTGGNPDYNPAGPNQAGISSNYNNDYISLQFNVQTTTLNFQVPSATLVRYTGTSSSDTFTTASAHGMSTGYGPIRISGSPLPTVQGTALNSTTDYWVIKASNTTFKLATTYNNAMAGTAINITDSTSRSGFTNVFQTSAAINLSTGNGPIKLSGTMPGGVTAGTNYWVSAMDSTHFRLATSQANATANTNFAVTSAGGTVYPNVLVAGTQPHGLTTGDGPYQLTGTLPGGLSTGTNYWVIATNTNVFEFATSYANATASTPTGISLTSSTTSNGTMTIPGVNPNTDQMLVTFVPPADGSDTSWNTGDGPVRFISTGTLPGGVGATTEYWIIKIDSTHIKLATTRANALAGLPVVDLTSAGSGTIYTVESPGAGVAFTSAGGTSLADQTARQKNWEKYVGKTYTGTNGPYRACAMQPILPMTNDKTAILSKISALNAAGNTHIPEGLAWGWRLVSPGAPFTEGVPYSNQSFRKAIVLMTDGDNTMPTEGSTLNASDYTAYGYASQARMGTGIDTVTEMQNEMGMGTGNNKLTRICNAVKALNIRLYTIAVQITNSNTRDMLEACATTDNGQQLYFNATDSASLTAAFAQIATDLSNLRVSH